MKTPKQIKVLHDKTTSPSKGQSLMIYDSTEQVSLQIEGTATSVDIKFECNLFDDMSTIWMPIEAIDVSETSETYTETSNINRVFFMNVEAVRYIRCNVVAISGGYVKIIALDYDVEG